MLSIIVPIYNAEKYLSETIESLIGQIYKDLEILLIDDGSTDSSGFICDEYATKFKNIIVFHKKNSGLISSWEFGIKKATGDYITFLDADDCINVNTYLDCMKVFEKYDCDLVVYGGAREYKTSFKMELSQKINYSVHYYGKKKEVLNQFIADNNSFDGFMWNKIWKSNIIKNQVIDNDGGLVFDALFVWKILKIIDSACYLNGKYHHYRYVLSSMSQSSTFEKYYKSLETWEFILTEYKKLKLDNERCVGNSYVVWCNKACQSLLLEPNSSSKQYYILMKRKLISSEEYIQNIGGMYEFQSKLFIKSLMLYKIHSIIINRLRKIYVFIKART